MRLISMWELEEIGDGLKLPLLAGAREYYMS